MDGASNDDTIKVADRSERPQPSAPASSVEDTMESNNLAAQISESIKELVRSDSDVSDFDLSSPLQHNTTLDSLDTPNSMNSLRSGQDSAEPRATDKSPLTSLDEAEEGGSEASSPLSTLSRTPTPPPEIYSSLPSPPSTSKRDTHPEIKQESPNMPAPTPKRLSQPPSQLPSGQANPQPRRLRRKDYEIECTHTDQCNCRIHAAHPSILKTSVIGGAERSYPHFSEWALGMMEWKESAMRSSIERKRDWRTGRAWK